MKLGAALGVEVPSRICLRLKVRPYKGGYKYLVAPMYDYIGTWVGRRVTAAKVYPYRRTVLSFDRFHLSPDSSTPIYCRRRPL